MTSSTCMVNDLETAEEFSIDDNNCKICMKEYTSPRILTCLHTFCKFLDSYMAHGFVETKKTNCTVIRIGLEQITLFDITGLNCLTALQSTALICTSCDLEQTIISYCFECKRYLCKSCENIHKSTSSFLNHKLNKINELRQLIQLNLMNKTYQCNNHPAKQLTHFCINCGLLKCMECLRRYQSIFTGADHQYKLLTNINSILIMDYCEFENLLKIVIQNVRFSEQLIKNLQKHLLDLHENCKESCNEIVKMYRQHQYDPRLVLDKDFFHQTLMELCEFYTEQKTNVTILMENTKQFIERVERSFEFTIKLLKDANNAVSGGSNNSQYDNSDKNDDGTSIGNDNFSNLKKIIQLEFRNLFTAMPTKIKLTNSSTELMNANNVKFKEITSKLFYNYKSNKM